jgi:hypothetical protein
VTASPIVRIAPPVSRGQCFGQFLCEIGGSGGDIGGVRGYSDRRCANLGDDGPSLGAGIVVGPAARWPALLVGLQQKKPAIPSTVSFSAWFRGIASERCSRYR